MDEEVEAAEGMLSDQRRPKADNIHSASRRFAGIQAPTSRCAGFRDHRCLAVVVNFDAVLVDVGAVADGGGDVGGAEEAESDAAVLVEVGGGQGLDAGAVLEEDAGDEDLELHRQAVGDGAEAEDDLDELAAVGVVRQDVVVGAVVAPDRLDLRGVEHGAVVAKARDEAVEAVLDGRQGERDAAVVQRRGRDVQCGVVLQHGLGVEAGAGPRPGQAHGDGGARGGEGGLGDVDPGEADAGGVAGADGLDEVGAFRLEGVRDGGGGGEVGDGEPRVGSLGAVDGDGGVEAVAPGEAQGVATADGEGVLGEVVCQDVERLPGDGERMVAAVVEGDDDGLSLGVEGDVDVEAFADGGDDGEDDGVGGVLGGDVEDVAPEVGALDAERGDEAGQREVFDGGGGGGAVVDPVGEAVFVGVRTVVDEEPEAADGEEGVGAPVVPGDLEGVGSNFWVCPEWR